jgi:SlyX protein
MNDIERLTARIDTLETRLAYQDQIVDDLNRTVTAQWTQIEGLAREMARLSDRVQQAEDRGGPAAPEPPPPHY